MKDKTVNGVKLNFFQVDCDADKATADKFNVQGFPTNKLVKGKKIIDYEAKPSKSTLTIPISAQSSLSHCTITRPGIVAGCNGTIRSNCP